MQKLKFINGNGVEVDLTDKVNFGIIAWEGFSADGLNIQSQQVPFQDGGVFLDALMEQRELSVTVAINAKGNLDKRYRLRRELISVLNPKLGEGVLIYTDNYLSKQIHVIPQIPLFDTNNSNDSGTPKASCSFTACNPYWEDLEETQVNFNPYEVTKIENKGDVSTQIKLDFLTTDALNPSISRLNDNKLIKYNGQLNDNLYIDTNIGNKNVVLESVSCDIIDFVGNFNSVCFVKNISMFVALSQGMIYTSLDGVDWKVRSTGFSYNLLSITYSEELNLIVVLGNVGESSTGIGHIITSSDGVSWTERANSRTLYSVTYSEEKHLFVAVGFQYILTSSNGINWTSINTEIQSNLYSVTYSQEKHLFVAVGTSGNIMTSSNGVSWNRITSMVEIYKDLYSVTYSEELHLFVAVGGNVVDQYENRRIITSSDGTNWTSVLEGLGTLKSVIYSQEKHLFMAVGKNGVILTSSDGANWNSVSSGVSVFLQSIIYSDELHLFVAVGETSIIVSRNIIDWNLKMENESYDIYSVVYSQYLNLFVAVGSYHQSNGIDRGAIFVSYDGVNWNSTHSYVYSNYFTSVTYSEELHLFVAVNNYSDIFTSVDGINWTSVYYAGPHVLHSVIFSKSLHMFVAVGENINNIRNCIYTSLDGTNWTEINIETYKNLYSVTYSEELHLFVAVGSEGVIVTSSDGVNWNLGSTGFTHYLYSVTYSEELHLFVAVGAISNQTRGIIMTSSNGVDWEAINDLNINQPLIGITYSEEFNFFMAVGENGEILSSSDGVSWNVITSGVYSTLMNVIYSQKLHLFLIVGFSKTILHTLFKKNENKIQNITSDSDMNLNLLIGNNLFRVIMDSGTLKCRITYRQKYIGV